MPSGSACSARRSERRTRQAWEAAGKAWSKEKLQSKLNDSHRSTQTADFADPWRIRRNRIDGRKSDVVGIAEIGRIECVECLGAELQLHLLGEVEILD